MLKIKCSICNSELNRPGALIFDPPDKNGKCFKYHLCRRCHGEMWYKLQELQFEYLGRKKKRK